MPKPKQIDPRALEVREKVRELSSRHNQRSYTPRRQQREKLLCEIFHWKSNNYVRRLLGEVGPVDTAHMYRCNQGNGNWIVRKQINGEIRNHNTGTVEAGQAAQERDRIIAQWESETTKEVAEVEVAP